MPAKQIYCTQCGAVIPPGEARCPYCGSSYAPEAEREYMRKLDQVRNDLDKVGNIGEETSRTEAGRIRKRVFRILAVILIFSAAIYGLFAYMQKREDRKNREEYLWRKDTIPALNQLYEQGDYDALMEEYQKAHKSGHSLYDWEHNAFCEYYEAAYYAGEALKMREKGLFEEEDAIAMGVDAIPLYFLNISEEQLVVPGAFEKEDFKIAIVDLINGEIGSKSYL